MEFIDQRIVYPCIFPQHPPNGEAKTRYYGIFTLEAYIADDLGMFTLGIINPFVILVHMHLTA